MFAASTATLSSIPRTSSIISSVCRRFFRIVRVLPEHVVIQTEHLSSVRSLFERFVQFLARFFHRLVDTVSAESSHLANLLLGSRSDQPSKEFVKRLVVPFDHL